MGYSMKKAMGPNPLSIKKRSQRVRFKKRRIRKGKRSKEISQLKKQSNDE